MNTLEGNKLIAKFLGCVIGNSGVALFEDGTTISIYQLNYHGDWNLLVEVVEKIEGLLNEKSERYLEVFIVGNSCQICHVNGYHFSTIQSTSKFEATYKAVLEFIQWYNTQTK